ncbi:MAG: GDP-mannose 4,6-dehydratase [Candidatus Hermodarchaeota archaeon]
MKKKALITGITGQDGSYLAEFLLSKDYEVHGIIRRASNFNTQRIEHIYQDPHVKDQTLFLHYGDVTDFGAISTLIHKLKPEEVYNLAAQSHVKLSFEMAEYTGLITGLGATCMLDAINKSERKAKYYQASSSEMFGLAPPPQDENTPFHPRSPYAVAKVYAYWITVNYRESYNMFCTNGILFNHESPRRGATFVTRKITTGLARIMAGKQKKIYLGNLESKRDWGFAPEYVKTMWRMLQKEESDDFVVGTGESHTVREFLEKAFQYVGWDWEDYIDIDSRYFRPADVDHLQANPSKAREILGWKPRINFDGLIKIMVDCDLKLEGLEPIGDGLELLSKEDFTWTKHKLTNG